MNCFRLSLLMRIKYFWSEVCTSPSKLCCDVILVIDLEVMRMVGCILRKKVTCKSTALGEIMTWSP